MSSDVVIRVAGLGKGFLTYDHPSHRLKQSLYNLAYRLAPLPPLKRWLRQQAHDAARTFWALRNIDLEIRRGETVGIIGRNGSGKSTLLQIICGTLSPSEGTVQTQGRVAALLELGSGFDPEYTGRENVYMNGKLHGLSKEQIDERFAEIAAFADIGDFIDQPVKTYSSGMFVRLAFAVIAHVDADILVVDEALAVGDAFFTQKCMRFLRKFMQTGTILFVSHDSSAVRSLCSRAIWIDRGAIVDSGSAKEVCNRYLEARYEAEQGKSKIDQTDATRAVTTSASSSERFDQRKKYTSLPSIEAPTFLLDPAESGDVEKAALIKSAQLLKADGTSLAWTTGGEVVTLRINASVSRQMTEAVLGFVVKDKLGRMLFGDSTFWVTQEKPLDLDEGEDITGEFTFAMPVLVPGNYAIDVAIADAGRPSHPMVQWLHDACIFKSEATAASTGLVGLPMNQVTLSLSHTETT
jgi:lipopolysaccharide transport system ATP-binding protein